MSPIAKCEIYEQREAMQTCQKITLYRKNKIKAKTCDK